MRTLVKLLLTFAAFIFTIVGLFSWFQANGKINYLVVIAVVLLILIAIAFRLLKSNQQQSKRR